MPPFAREEQSQAAGTSFANENFSDLSSESVASSAVHCIPHNSSEHSDSQRFQFDLFGDILPLSSCFGSKNCMSHDPPNNQTVQSSCPRTPYMYQHSSLQRNDIRSEIVPRSLDLACRPVIKKERASSSMLFQSKNHALSFGTKPRIGDLYDKPPGPPPDWLGHGEHKQSKSISSIRPKIRRYSRATPSRFCHICARSNDIVALVPCRNVHFGVCRKTVCLKCFQDQGWDWNEANANPSLFSCSHCMKCCPPNAQCRTYQRTNERRRQICMKKRLVIEAALANGGDIDTLLALNQLE